MAVRGSRFERRILLAVSLAGLVPFLVWLAVGIKLLVDPPLALHRQAELQFETARLFYKEFIDAKKSEFSARAESIARDVVLREAIERANSDDAEHRLRAIIHDYPSIRRIEIFTPMGERLLAADGPEERMSDAFAERTWQIPLGLGDAPKMHIVFLLPIDYQKRRDALQQFYESYGLALRAGTKQQRLNLVRFAAITAVVLIFALALGFVLARRVTRRVTVLARATERVARGELDLEIPLAGDDEITELTAAFNKMVAEIAAARDRIVYLEKVSGWQDLARRLAHEIKNPLTPIQLAMQEILRRFPEDGDPKFRALLEESAEIVKDEIGALTRLVDEFSQFARLPEVSAERVDLVEFVREFLDHYNGFVPDAEVALDLPAERVLVEIDRLLMRRVLYNLATNAIHAAGAGATKIHIRAEPAVDHVLLRVEDNGPGVPEDHAARIFEPYFTTKSDGTGLGLAIAKKIVLQHRGTVALERAASGGAAFVIWLPRVPA